jgi:hypothetical protein
VTPTVLIDAIVRQTTVLLAQLATGERHRATLAHTASEVFRNLVQELKSQGISNKGIADMFGMTLRTYHYKVSRFAESRTQRGRSLWEALFGYIEQNGTVTRAQILQRFMADEEEVVRGVLREIVGTGLVFQSGRGESKFYRVATPEERPHARPDQEGDPLAMMLWVAVTRFGPIDRAGLLQTVPAEAPAFDRALAELVADGRVQVTRDGGNDRYHATHFHIPVGSAAGWEAAVFDHFQALVTTLTMKLRLREAGTVPEEWVGGSTYSFDVSREHPLFGEVTGFLSATRERAVSLRARVFEVNQARPVAPSDLLRVVVYVGQSILGIEDQETDHE